MINPYLILFITFTILVMSIYQSLMRQKVSSMKFFLVALYLFVIIVVVFFNNNVLDDLFGQGTYDYYSIFILAIFVIEIMITFNTSLLKVQHYDILVKMLKNSKFNIYYMVDQKERVKDISVNFLLEIGLDKEDVIGKKISNILNKRIRISKINDVKSNNKSFQQWSQSYSKGFEKNLVQVQEIEFQNTVGETSVIQFMIQPVMVFGNYKGRIALGEKKADLKLVSQEKELESIKEEYNEINQKLKSIFLQSQEGLLFINLLNNKMTLSNQASSFINKQFNDLTVDEFYDLFQKEDIGLRETTLQKLKLNEQYELKYRLKISEKLIWFIEKGNKISDNLILATVNKIDTNEFSQSGSKNLDELKTNKDIEQFIDERRKNNLYCDVLFIRLTNIKEINNDYGREVGNLFISEYVKKMKESFVSNNGDVFRMGGTSFIITLTDPNKSSIIDNSIKSGKPFLDVQMNYGNISSVLKVSGVIKNSKIFGNIKTDLTSLKNKLKSLRTFEDKRPVIRDND